MTKNMLIVSLILLTLTLAGCLEVYVDIRPGSCPNPINVNSKGMVPVAVLGTEEFDVSSIDPTTVRVSGVEEVSPVRWHYEDVSTPSTNGECTTAGPDGYIDLVFQFDLEELVATGKAHGYEMPEDGSVGTIMLVGKLRDGTEIWGTDDIVVRIKGKD